MTTNAWIRRAERFDEYVDRLAAALGHVDRHEPLRAYCTGLLLEGERKSVEPIAARIEPDRVSARHQSLLHFVGQSPWSDDAVLDEVCGYSLPAITASRPIEAWILDDTSIAKKGTHSVGVAHQYCGSLGKTANCQVAVTLSLANEEFSLPVGHRLYLPESWAADTERREKVGVPGDINFKRKWEIGLDLIDAQLAKDDTPAGVVLADAAYGDAFEFREGLGHRRLGYVVGVSKTTTVWEPGKQPLTPVRQKDRGRPPTRLRRTEDHHPVTALELARSLPAKDWQDVRWRDGTAGEMKSRFVAVRVRPAHRDDQRTQPHPEQWLLIEWPPDEDEPTHYWLSNLPPDVPLPELVRHAMLRWHIERDYQDLKQEVGFDQYQGRSWRGFHHHMTLCIAAYAFLMVERTRLFPPQHQPPIEVPPLPEGYRPRGSPRPDGPPRADIHQNAAH